MLGCFLEEEKNQGIFWSEKNWHFQKLNGKITSVKKFGAFVELENGKSGLVHISELSEKFVEKVEDVVSVGQEVTVRVKEVTPEGKINLSMKPARPEKPARPALDLDKAITNFLKDSDEKQSALKKNMKTQRRRSN